MKLAIVYTSVTGNTKELAEEIYRCFRKKSIDTTMYSIDEFQEPLTQFNAVVIGTYTWGNGEIPKEMRKLFEAFEAHACKEITTAVFGTGDSCYPHYCGAVDLFRDMLYVHTNLAATLKVELRLQPNDRGRCQRFAESILNRM